MNKIYTILWLMGVASLGLVVSGPAYALNGPARGYEMVFKDEGGATIRVCRDNDGYVVSHSGGSTSYGTGYKWSDLEGRWNLKQVIRSPKRVSSC